MARPKLHEMPDWPRLMPAETAAAYCGGVSVAFFLDHFANVRPQVYGNRKLWDREDLDAEIARRKGGAVPVTGADWLRRLDGAA